MASKKEKKKSSRIADVIFYIFLIGMVTMTVVILRGRNGRLGVGGYHVFEVLSSSMESVYPRGSIIIAKETPEEDLKVGDDIAFVRSDNHVITHRIIEIHDNYEGSAQRGFVTQGVENAAPDEEIVIYDNIVGKVEGVIAHVGAILRWMGENLVIVLVFCVSLIGFVLSFRIFYREVRKEKQEKKRKRSITKILNKGEDKNE